MSRSRKNKNTPYHQARRAYRQDELAEMLTMPEQKFGAAFGMETVLHLEQALAGEDYYHFRDNGSRVLAVAHLDTVVGPKKREPHFYATQSGPALRSGALDDRLGAYVILRLLPKLGLAHDWLLTVGEESCSSTAQFFNPAGKDYDWVIEFDRAGTDVVMYQFEDETSRQLVKASGAPVGVGSFSDIACLEHLGVKAFNWGVGYRGNYHSANGYAYLTDTFAMVAKYMRFHAQNAGTVLGHEPDLWPSYRSRSSRYESADYIDCPHCQACQGVHAGELVCDFCNSCFDCGETVRLGAPCPCYSEKYLGRTPEV